MKSTVLLMLTFGLMGSACSSDEDFKEEPQKSAGEISFYAMAPKSSRAASTTTSSLKEFVVYAFTDSSVVMNGVTVKKDGGAWTYSPPVYWPASPVDFYAVSPDIRTGQGQPSDDYSKIMGIEYGSTDLLYAVSPNEVESPAPVPLTFRHAMSKVSVMLSSTSDRYMIEVKHVSLNNIVLSGDFALPTQNTGIGTVAGIWSGLSAAGSALLYYDIEGGSVLLTTTPKDLTEGNLEASFFVPQDLTALQYSAANGFTGTFMQIDCVVKDKATGQKIWPNEHTPEYLQVPQSECGRMVFPLASDTVDSWKQGFAYIYNVVINTTYSVDTIEFSPVVKDYVQTQPF